MSSSQSLTLIFRNEPIDSGRQFSIHSDVLQESNETAFDLHGMYQGRD